MRGTFFKGALVGGIGAAVVLAASAAFAGTGIGAVFNLGQTNTVNETSTLTGAKAGKLLQLNNTSTGAGATAAGFKVANGHPPFTVSSHTKVGNLNADLLDGQEAADLVGARAYAHVSGDNCAGVPTPFCVFAKSKRVAYVARIGVGEYCIGVDGIDQSAPDSFALVGVSIIGPTFGAAVLRSGNSGCVAREFEVRTYTHADAIPQPTDLPFWILVP